MILELVTGLGKFFFLLWEIGYSSWLGKPVYTLERTMGTVGCEILRALAGLVIVPAFVGGYSYLSNHYSLLSLSPSSVFTWILAVLIFSFVDYWSHRWSHTVPFLWAIHSVHHQVEELNAIAGGRVSFLNDILTLGMTCFLAVVGVPLSVTLGVVGVAALYSVVLHCPLLGSFGWLGHVVATPAFHRLHHGIQPQYLNKNFSISLSFWDRIFGTYVEESVPPKYGLINGFATNSPFRANWQPWVDYFTKTPRTYSASTVKRRSLSQRAYLLVQLILVLYCASLLQSKARLAWPIEMVLLVVGAVLGSLATLDGLLRRSRAARYLEGIRVGLFMPLLLFLTGKGDWSGDSFWWIWGGGFFCLCWVWTAFRKDNDRASKSRLIPPAAAA